VLGPVTGQGQKEKMKNQAIAAVREQEAPVNRPVQALLLCLWTANIAFFLYSVLKHGWTQPW
jgi:hypothetical protein